MTGRRGRLAAPTLFAILTSNAVLIGISGRRCHLVSSASAQWLVHAAPIIHNEYLPRPPDGLSLECAATKSSTNTRSVFDRLRSR